MFHNIRFSAVKKRKREAEGNGFIHQLTNMVDGMKQMGDGNNFVFVVLPLCAL